MTDATARFHVRFGWLALAVFVTVGLVLEALHGFKLGWYVDVGAENRRLMLTLGHAHGSLLGLLNLGFAASARFLPDALPTTLASWGLRVSTVLLPAGFLTGGLFLAGTDPGLGVFLVPVGGLALLVAVLGAAVASFATR